MKRESRKKRKLQYIREKNAYRNGVPCNLFFKMSSDIMEDKLYCESLINNQINAATLKLKKKFKMNFDHIKSEIGLCDDDFIRDIITVKLQFNVIW